MKNQFMPIFWGDFLANTLHLSAQEAGAYLFLIAHAWEHGGAISYRQAQRIARVDNRHWRHVRETLEPFFELERDAKGVPRRYVHQRVLSELATADKLKSKRSAAGMAGAIKRWGNPMANAMPKTWQTQWPRHSKLPSKKDNLSSFPLPREPSDEPKQEAADKRPCDVSRAELEAKYAAKPKQG